ncbi:c-type cytochrome biogenesis protein CcmI [Salinicola rhizosphaerae]|uniref:C-type cytochrome biogenesis protein CcmI n=1 Tax=Salinicola rhizosphaerae TaxID=1443141 RepID=A0ABQ3DYV7_9GAMM|nr:c-type cytochrome biogenesis protein CcmI [Salinicola rhizosphaerae]GHB20736.1 c-type cytochrome biogenesis protein CcmI [Salinicola rhizosphaerae]
MTALYIGIALLLMLALWLLWLPVRRAAGLRDALMTFEADDRNNAENVAIYRQRLAALELALVEGEIDRERFAEDRLELDRRLLEDAGGQGRRPLKRVRAGRWLLPLVAILLVVAALVFYERTGDRQDLELYQVVESVAHAPPETKISVLAAEAQRQSDNPKAWAQLFPLYRDNGQFDQAIDTLERLVALQGRQPQLLAQLAQMKFFAADRTVTDDVQSLIDETLELDPRQPTVLGVLGIDAFDHARYREAIDYWRRAMAGYQDDESGKALRKVIAVAQQRLDARAGQASTADSTASAPAASLQVDLTLAPSLSERLPADTPVFLVARDVDGQRPPLAIAQTTLGALPQTLTLSDAQAMTPQAKLSQVDHVDLVARVSASGQAQPQSGDLFGRLQDVVVGGDHALTLDIDQVVP